jgi:hypothetical protein
MRLLPCVMLLSFLVLESEALGQAPVPLKPHQTIPGKPFTSWSLFLVCDPAWLLPGQETALRDLQVRYRAFGDTTGPSHAAVWFENVVAGQQVTGSVDVGRNVEYCRKFQLVPSEGPHVVVTTIHPDQWKAGDSKIVLAFAGRSAQDMQGQLSKLNDQIAAQRLSQKELDSVAWWSTWTEIIETTCTWLSKVKWSVDAKVAKVERSGICS